MIQKINKMAAYKQLLIFVSSPGKNFMQFDRQEVSRQT